MPGQRHSGKLGVPWARCDRCKWDYPHNRLTMQDGLLLCLDKCVDQTTVWTRGEVIQNKLRFPREEPFNVTAQKRQYPNVIRPRGWTSPFPETFFDIRALDLTIWRVKVSKDGVLYASVVEAGSPLIWSFDGGAVDFRLKVDSTGLLFVESIGPAVGSVFSMTLVGPDGSIWRVFADPLTGLLEAQKQ